MMHDAYRFLFYIIYLLFTSLYFSDSYKFNQKSRIIINYNIIIKDIYYNNGSTI